MLVHRCEQTTFVAYCTPFSTLPNFLVPQHVIFRLAQPSRLFRVGIYLHGENNQNPKRLMLCSIPMLTVLGVQTSRSMRRSIALTGHASSTPNLSSAAVITSSISIPIPRAGLSPRQQVLPHPALAQTRASWRVGSNG